MPPADADGPGSAYPVDRPRLELGLEELLQEAAAHALLHEHEALAGLLLVQVCQQFLHFASRCHRLDRLPHVQ